MQIIDIIPYRRVENKDFQTDTILKIENTHFQNVVFQDGIIALTFYKCRFQKVTLENFEIIDFKDISIQFVDCYIKSLESSNIETENISIYFSSSIVSGKIESKQICSVSFNNTIIRDSFFLIGQNTVNISYTEENIFAKRWKILMESINIANYLDLLETKQSYHICNTKKINFKTSELEGKSEGLYRINYQKIVECEIGYCLSKLEKASLNLNLYIEYLQKVENSDTKIVDSFLNSLSIEGHLNGTINIENTKIENWFIRNFSVQKEANFYNISPLNLPNNESKFEIHRCNLDNTWFDNINFSDYKTISFYKTKFGKTRFDSCSFPTDYTSFEKFRTLENIHNSDKESDNYYENQYGLFLQLKVSLEASGNFYESQKLQAISNDALKKIKSISQWDKAILWINSKSNNHGLSIKQPLKYFIIFSVLFYVLYLFSLDRIFNSNEIDYSLFGYYFSFVDLTHRTDFLVSKEEYNFGSLTFDFANKIFSGFFIYQFISAFRKYGKK